jgi:asparagine synthetase B (glutamine-hydrolysing)
VLGEYRNVLQRAVDRRMALGGDAVLLSGGVDSITVAILAADYIQRNHLPPLIAASVAPAPGYPLNTEARLQEPVARRLGMPFVRRDVQQLLGGEELLRQSLCELAQLPAPDSIYWMSSHISFLRTLHDMGHRLLLSGSGGDEWLGVHDAIAADYVRTLSLARLLRLAQLRRRDKSLSRRQAAAAVFWQAGIKRHLASYRARLFPDQWTKRARRRVQAKIPYWLNLDPHLHEELITSIIGSYTHPLAGDGHKPRSYYWHALATAYHNSRITYENERNYHIYKNLGIQVFSPFHDRQAIRFFQHVDPQLLLYSRRNKGLLRSFAADELPGLGLDRQEKLYYSPQQNSSFIQDSLVEQVARVGKNTASAHLERLNLVKKDQYQRALADSSSFSFEGMIYLFTVSAVEMWLRGMS